MSRLPRIVVLSVLGALLAVSLAACGPGEPAPPNEVEAAIEMHFGPYGPDVVEEAKRVARCESGWNPDATNGQYLGLFQMGAYHYWRFEGNAWNDPYVNARAAGGLWAESHSWRHWSCKP